MKVSVPALSLVVLVGPSGSGKTTLAHRFFAPTEVVSFEACLPMVGDADDGPEASRDAFELMRYIARTRLAAGRLTVVDATNIGPEERARLIEAARECHAIAIAIVLNLPGSICQARTERRAGRQVAMRVVHVQTARLHKTLGQLPSEGFEQVVILRSPNDVDALEVERVPMSSDRRSEHGPFDVIGDVHGCFDELVALLKKLGYRSAGPSRPALYEHPEGRRAVFLGDLVDRGPDTPRVLELVMAMVRAGSAFAVAGNHEVRLAKALAGAETTASFGLPESLAQLAQRPPEFVEEARGFLEGLPDHLVFDDGQLVAAHAGLPAAMHGRGGEAVRAFARLGETEGDSDDYGPVPVPLWVENHAGSATVVYGHLASPEVIASNHTFGIDTGCVYGGKLTALRYPEIELVDVPARAAHYVARELAEDAADDADSGRGAREALIDVEDVTGKRTIKTRVLGSITIQEENASAAFEVLSRFSVDPRWLVYLPPDVAPSDTCRDGPTLEHPREAFAYFWDEGVPSVVCERKHAGTRAVMVVCRDENAAVARFGVGWGSLGSIYTRTGRRFFSDSALELEVIARTSAALDRAGIFDELGSEWVCLEADLAADVRDARSAMREHFVGTGTAARASVGAALAALRLAVERSDGCEKLLYQFTQHEACVDGYVEAERHMELARTEGSRRAPAPPVASAVVPRMSTSPGVVRAAAAPPPSSATTPRPDAARASQVPSSVVLPRASALPPPPPLSSSTTPRPASAVPRVSALPPAPPPASTAAPARSDVARGSQVPGTSALPRAPAVPSTSALPRISSPPPAMSNAPSVAAPPPRAPVARGPFESRRDPVGVTVAPVHLLASQGHVHTDRDHVWHLTTVARLAEQDAALFVKTEFRRVELRDAAAERDAIAWWDELTAGGGEGFVMRPLAWIARGKRNLVQPGLKSRGREFLRTVYGPGYTLDENLERLRERAVSAKRSLALREFALGLEALQRFVDGEPASRVHECIGGMLALGSEATDPRL